MHVRATEVQISDPESKGKSPKFEKTVLIFP